MPTTKIAESPVLLIDDGELTDVRRLLDRLGVSYEARTGTADLESAGLRKLLVTNSRHGVAIRRGRAGTWRAAGFHIIVYDAQSRTLKGVLERSGCDFVVQSPIHPEAFRLLVAHALYAGPERRALNRAAMAAPVKVQTGRRARPATLLQLSTRGGGLLTGFKVKAGSDIRIVLPRELTGGPPLELSGRVLDAQPSLVDGPKSHQISVGFRMLGRPLRDALSEVMRRHAFGAAALVPRASEPGRPSESAPSRPDPAPVAAEPEAAPEPEASMHEPSESGAGVLERRKSPRKPFARQVLATGGGSSHALIGSDLSVGGMRVRPDPTLAVGAEVKLAIYGSAGIPPVLLKAEVTRDDGADGLVIQFRKVSPAAAAALERLVESLPGAAGTRGPDVVVSEILERS